jgi:dTMP kinase
VSKLFISFEGVEGCGKSTQVKMAAEALDRLDRPCLKTEEPGGSALGKEIRRVLLNRSRLDISAETELLLFMADRAQHIREVVLPALAAEKIVLCDRFADATIAYQGFGRGMDIEMIERLNRFVCGDLKPDLTFLFDLPVETGLERAVARESRIRPSAREDRFESEAPEFHRRVREGYLALARREPKRFRIIDGMKSIAAVHEEVLSAVEEIIKGRT